MKNLLLICSVACAALLCGGCATPFEKQLALAQKGDANAQYHVGMVYGTGKGGTLSGDKPVEKNSGEAVFWLGKSSASGNGKASLALGLCYYYHHAGILRDYSNYERAFQYFKKAEARGVTDAYLWLGECYLKGRGVDQDEKKAIDYFQKGAEETSDMAKYCMSEIASCYLFGYGVGVRRNLGDAKSWYKLAADNGDTQAQSYFDKNVLTQEYFNRINAMGKGPGSAKKAGYRIKRFTKKSNYYEIEAEVEEGADAFEAWKAMRDQVVADCENDLKLQDSRLSRADITWNFNVPLEEKTLKGRLFWYTLRVLSCKYNDATHDGVLVIDMGGQEYQNVQSFVIRNLQQVCEDKLVAIEDGKIPQGSRFKIEDHTQDGNRLTVHFHVLN